MHHVSVYFKIKSATVNTRSVFDSMRAWAWGTCLERLICWSIREAPFLVIPDGRSKWRVFSGVRSIQICLSWSWLIQQVHILCSGRQFGGEYIPLWEVSRSCSLTNAHHQEIFKKGRYFAIWIWGLFTILQKCILSFHFKCISCFMFKNLWESPLGATQWVVTSSCWVEYERLI